VAIPLYRRSARRPLHPTAAEHVRVYMKYRLAGLRAGV